MSKKILDLDFGKLKEIEIKQILEQYFKTTLQTTSKYNLIDFQNDDLYIELKSRRNTYICRTQSNRYISVILCL